MEEKSKRIYKVIKEFDFEKARALLLLTKDLDTTPPTVDMMKTKARELLATALDHKPEECWWGFGPGIFVLHDNFGRLWLTCSVLRKFDKQ